MSQNPTDTSTPPRCLDCGYILAGSTGNICPECGHSFDPTDPATFDDGSKRHWVDPRHPPSLANRVTIIGITAAALFDMSVPGTSCFMSLGYWIWMVLVGGALIRFVAQACETGPAVERERQKNRLHWLEAPICAAVLIPTAVLPWPLYLRFYLSKASLETAARQLRGGQTCNGGWIGLYYIHGATQIGSTGNVIFTTGYGFMDEYGFIQVQTHDPESRRELDRIAPSWYVFFDRF